jgi:serine/threonine-protein kinase
LPNGPLPLRTPEDVEPFLANGLENQRHYLSGRHPFFDLETGTITTVAGTGSGDGGPATKAEVGGRVDMYFDLKGNLYLSEYYSNRIRRIDTTGIITTVTGGGAQQEDGVPAAKALIYPAGVYVDAEGNIWIDDWYTCRVRIGDTSGIIWTVAGTGTGGYSGDGGPALEAGLRNPSALRAAPDGSSYFIDVRNTRVRKLYRP